MGELTISEVGERTGLASSALRFYERKGLLEPVGRRGGMRVYDERVVEQVALVDLLKVAGFTLAEIADLVDTRGRVADDWRAKASAKHESLGRRLDELALARSMLEHTVECPHESLHECPVHQQVVAAHARALQAGGRRPARGLDAPPLSEGAGDPPARRRTG